MEKQKNAIGRRKEAVTRVFLSKGDGKITVNGKDYKTYFPLVYFQFFECLTFLHFYLLFQQFQLFEDLRVAFLCLPLIHLAF